MPNLPPRDWALALTAGSMWMLFNVGFIVLLGFGPGVLVSRGASLGGAGFQVSLAVWISVLSVPLGGVVVDRMRRPNVAIVVGCVLTALAIERGGSTKGTAIRDGYYKIDRYEGLIKTYTKPFSSQQHDALNEHDYVWAQFIDNQIVPVGMKQ